MYCFKEMIAMGPQEWSNPFTRTREGAATIAIGNPFVTSKDAMIDIVQSVLKVPSDRIKLVTLMSLLMSFGCPVVW